MDRSAVRKYEAGAIAVLASLAAAKLLLHFLVNGRYGYWIDELYFIACGEHLAWGYVDQPPLIAFVAAASRWLMGDSLFAIRFFPAVAGACLVFLTGWMARELGGGRFAQVLAAVTVLVAPIYLAFNNLLTMNAFEPLLWTLCAYLAILIVKHGNQKLWLLFGLVAGIGLLNKYSMAFFAVSLAGGLLLTPARKVFLSPWLWFGGLLAFLIVLPNLLWEQTHGWPTVELLRNAKLYQHQPVSPAEFIWGQIELVHPFTLPIWLAGVAFTLLRAAGRPVRFLGWTFVLLFGASLLGQAKTYYLAPIYPIMFAAGAVATERFIAVHAWNWLKPAAIVFLLIGGVISAPYVLPVLPIAAVPQYLSLVKVRDVRPERRAEGQIPQLFADMFGSQERVAAVARAYQALPPEERSRCAIWGRDYGEAGAIDFFGRAYGLPHAISGHQNYYLWGPGPYTGECVITMNIAAEVLKPWFDRVELADTVHCDYCMPDKASAPIHVCRGLKQPLRDFWPKVKCWTCDKPAFAREALGIGSSAR
jgi:4-amino-4-deoxy-L-arabinose transferase-like glycosyltransferase